MKNNEIKKRIFVVTEALFRLYPPDRDHGLTVFSKQICYAFHDGRGETMTIKDGVLDGGEFAHIYFIDWDHVHARHRQLNITVMGTTEDVGDRRWNNGETINTLRKYTDQEKAYDVHYDLQQKR